MSQESQKQTAAAAAIKYIEWDWVVGVGTGSTANYFIDELAMIKANIDGAVASSEASAERLRAHGIRVLELDNTGDLPVYVDGADESTRHLHLVKGGGAAMTRGSSARACSWTTVSRDRRSEKIHVSISRDTASISRSRKASS